MPRQPPASFTFNKKLVFPYAPLDPDSHIPDRRLSLYDQGSYARSEPVDCWPVFGYRGLAPTMTLLLYQALVRARV